jgi:hypothetical protein
MDPPRCRPELKAAGATATTAEVEWVMEIYSTFSEQVGEVARLYGAERMDVIAGARDTMQDLKSLPAPPSMQAILHGAIALGREHGNRGGSKPTFRAYCDLYRSLRRSGLDHTKAIGTIHERWTL